MFKYKYTVLKKDNKTTYGSICIDNIVFEPLEIQEALPEIVLQDENLKHMFAEDDLTEFRRKNIYKSFIPKTRVNTDLSFYIEQAIKNNSNYYSFFAEGILGLVFRDLYRYNLAKGVIDVSNTLNDTHTGVDACMYNLDNNVLVLGEAKFYESRNQGINKIISDLVNMNIKNKLESLQKNSEVCEESNSIIIKNLKMDNYDELTVDEFINQKIIFAGFVLHSEKNIEKYGESWFYDNYSISSKKLKENIVKSLKIDDVKGDYEIILVHLPIKDKKQLILKMIEAAKIRLKGS